MPNPDFVLSLTALLSSGARPRARGAARTLHAHPGGTRTKKKSWLRGPALWGLDNVINDKDTLRLGLGLGLGLGLRLDLAP